jgi:hypothetical protein
MARYNASDESSNSANHHNASEEEEVVVLVAEAPAIAVEEDGSDIDGGNIDNFPTVLPSFEEELEGSY